MPDLRDLHASVAKRLEERLTSNIDALSPATILQNWFAFNASGAQELMSRFFGGGFGMPAVKKTDSSQP